MQSRLPGSVRYVGISKHLFARVQEHIRGTDHFTATLAHQMAVERYPHGTIATIAIKDPVFRSRFDEARENLRNPLELYLFEPYCARELGTGRDEHGRNTFVAHQQGYVCLSGAGSSLAGTYSRRGKE